MAPRMTPPVSSADKKKLLGRLDDLVEASVHDKELAGTELLELANNSDAFSRNKAQILSFVLLSAALNRLVEVQAQSLKLRLLSEPEGPKSLLATRGQREE